MSGFLPRTLFGQTVLVLIAGIGAALLAGILIWASDRREAVRTVGALSVAERIVNVTRLIGDTAEPSRRRIVDGAGDPHFRVALVATRPELRAGDQGDGLSSIVADYLRQALPRQSIDVVVSQSAGGQRADRWPWRGPDRGMQGYGPGVMGQGAMGPGPMMHAPMMRGPLAHAAMSWRQLDAAVQLADDRWLRFSTTVPDQGPAVSPRLLLALALVASAIVLLSAWTVRRMTIPLDTLASAAQRLGRDVAAPPLTVAGSIEVRRAASAFNEMQARLRQLIDNRTLMLAAISHDLRTQLTLLRLRTETADGGDDRGKMLKTIGEMEDMLSATLSFARDDGKGEASRRVDVSALVVSIIDDMSEAGMPVVSGQVQAGLIVECRPVALRRALANLIDNAVKYGERATVSLSTMGPNVAIDVDDEGPGIPEDQLSDVLQPFYRIEDSRNRDTGGIGLGLAIASSIAENHGGALKLSNRRQKGLRATFEIPR